MARNIFLHIALVCAVCLFGACNVHRTTMQSFYSTATEYLNDEGDGSLTLRAYGQGRYRRDALMQARKNAVSDVLFKGIAVPGNTTLSRALVLETNGRERHEDFFNEFFKDGGAYTRFVDHADRRYHTNEKHWNGTQVKISTTVRVRRAELKNYLKEQGIIK